MSTGFYMAPPSRYYNMVRFSGLPVFGSTSSFYYEEEEESDGTEELRRSIGESEPFSYESAFGGNSVLQSDGDDS